MARIFGVYLGAKTSPDLLMIALLYVVIVASGKYMSTCAGSGSTLLFQVPD
jgi:hypothetical protein